MAKNFAIIDLSNLFHRARHVTIGDPITKAGMSVHIIFKSLRKVSKEFNIDHFVFCIDNGSWRYNAYPSYKASRKASRLSATEIEKEEAETFFAVMADLTTYLTTKTRCTVLNSKGIEGDDFVGRWVQLHPADNHVIVSGDSDFIQLLAPNVRIFDGINSRVIATDGVTDIIKNHKLEFTVDTGSGKIKIGKKNPDFIPEQDWWKRALFIKIVRGDPGDGIYSTNLGVRYNGSAKKVGIKEAWEDRNAKGFHWNNFMQTDWVKLGTRTANGETTTVTVAQEFKINESLIDLTKQPDTVKDQMDEAIVDAASKSLDGNRVGIDFIRFCAKHDLPNLQQEADDHVRYLNQSYSTF